MKTLKLLFALLLTTVALMAQPRLYVVPVIGTGTTDPITGIPDPRRPKYFSDRSVITSPWGGADYGFEPVMIVGASLTASEDAFVSAQADVFALPFNLDTSIGAVGTVQNALESRNIPGSWVANGMTYRQVARTVLGMFSFFQRMGAVYAEQNGTVPGSIFDLGVTLNGTFQTMPQAIQTAFIATGISFGFDAAIFSPTATLRSIMKVLADRFAGVPYILGPVQI